MGRSFQVLLYHRSGFDRAAWSRVLRGRTYQVIRRCRHTTGPGIGRYRPSACASPAILTGGSFRGGNNPMPRGSATPPGPRRGPGRTGETAGGPRRCTSRDPHLVPGTEGVTVGRMTPLHLEGLDAIAAGQVLAGGGVSGLQKYKVTPCPSGPRHRRSKHGHTSPGSRRRPGGVRHGSRAVYTRSRKSIATYSRNGSPLRIPGSKMPVVENAVGPERGSKPGFRSGVFGARVRCFASRPDPYRGSLRAVSNLQKCRRGSAPGPIDLLNVRKPADRRRSGFFPGRAAHIRPRSGIRARCAGG